jgi:hypothetical protein
MALFPSPRIRLHEVLERGKSATTTLKIYEDGIAITPTSADFSLVGEDGKDVVAYTAATIVGTEISYLVPSSSIPTSIAFSDSYLIRWKVLISGKEYIFRRSCAIARSKLYPVINDPDLESHYSDIASIRPSSMTSYQTYITEAFIQIVQRLRDNGNFEYLIIDNQSLRSIHLDLTFYLIWKDMDSSGLGEGRYLQLAQEHRKSFDAGFKRLKLRYDLSEQGVATDPDGGRPAKAPMFTAAPPRVWRRW